MERAGELARWLRALAAVLDDPGSVTSTHVGQFVTACNSSFRDLTPSLDHLHANKSKYLGL